MMMTESPLQTDQTERKRTKVPTEAPPEWTGQMTALPERDQVFVQEVIRLLADPERHQEGEWLRQGCAVIKCDPATGALRMHLHLGGN